MPRVDSLRSRASIEALQALSAIWVQTICSIPAPLVGIEMAVRGVRVEMVGCGSARVLAGEITLWRMRRALRLSRILRAMPGPITWSRNIWIWAAAGRNVWCRAGMRATTRMWTSKMRRTAAWMRAATRMRTSNMRSAAAGMRAATRPRASKMRRTAAWMRATTGLRPSKMRTAAAWVRTTTTAGMRHCSRMRCSGLRMRRWGGMAAATPSSATSRVRLPRLSGTEPGRDAQHKRYGAHR